MIDKLKEFIVFGEDLREAQLNKTYTNDLFNMYQTQWLSEIKIFNETHLKNHPLNRDIFRICFHKQGNACVEMLGVLNAILNEFNCNKFKDSDERGNDMMKSIDELITALCDLHNYPGLVNLQCIPYVNFKNDLTTFIYSHNLQNTVEWRSIQLNLVTQTGQHMIDEEADVILSHLHSLQKKMLEDKSCKDSLRKSVYSDLKFKNSDRQTPSLSVINSDCIENKNSTNPNNENTYDKIFISHKSNDKKYGDALVKLLREIGLDDEQIIYTSSPRHKIPLNQDFSAYLRNNINERIYAIYLFSESYLQSPICMNEMGAFWVKQSDYTNTFIPDFDFSNPNFVKEVEWRENM